MRNKRLLWGRWLAPSRWVHPASAWRDRSVNRPGRIHQTRSPRRCGGNVARVDAEESAPPSTAAAAPPLAKRPWPVGLAEQMKAVGDVVATTPHLMSLDDLAGCLTARGRWRDRLPTILDTPDALGRVRRLQADRWQRARHNGLGTRGPAPSISVRLTVPVDWKCTTPRGRCRQTAVSLMRTLRPSRHPCLSMRAWPSRLRLSAGFC